jgi:outer membrane protein assembly factor BamB
MPEMRLSPRIIGVILIAVSIVPVVVHLAGRRAARVSSKFPMPERIWEFTTGKPFMGDGVVEHSPALDTDGTIYAGGDRGLYALEPGGGPKWFHEVGTQVRYTPIIYTLIDDKGNIWFDYKNESTGGVYRLDPNGNGAAVISSASTAPVLELGVANEGTIFLAMVGGTTVLNPDGTVASVPMSIRGRESTNIPRLMVTVGDRPIPAGRWDGTGINFAFASDNRLYETRENYLESVAPDRTVEWWTAVTDPEGQCSPPALGTDRTIYVGCSGKFSAFTTEGVNKWSFSIPCQVVGSPSIAEDGTVYFGCDDKNVYALAPDGTLKWKFAANGKVLSTPAIARNGTIYFGDCDGKLYAVSSDGRLEWEFAAHGRVFSPTIAPDGTIYAQSADGKIYAVRDNEPNGGLWGQWPKLGGGPSNTERGPALD